MDPGTSPTPKADARQLAEEVLRACKALGFAGAGIVEPAESSHPETVRNWLSAGKHGDMAWMTEYLDERVDARKLLPGARSMLLVADRYAAPDAQDGSRPRPLSGRVARYARGRDYHDQFRKRLGSLVDRLRQAHPREKFRLFVDTGPVLEREHAARAGLGFIGKHTLLIDPHAGSYIVLGGLVTTLAMSEPAPRRALASHCGGCTRCIDACPTGAITPFSVDARRCISYLTIEHEGLIDPEFHGPMGDWVFGCDVCQDVCPFNSTQHTGARVGVNPVYRSRDQASSGSLDLLEVLEWTSERRQDRLGGTAAKRASLSMIRRNAVIAIGNDPASRHSETTLDRLRSVADSEPDPLVRATAQQVLERIESARARDAQGLPVQER